mmetsp:Transcript_4408/g.13026  ORF Transcript_4408/g.13026 Transcript_4408/m.13026 type:complete len:288 (+) Transcript_4408:92-955(+)
MGLGVCGLGMTGSQILRKTANSKLPRARPPAGANALLILGVRVDLELGQYEPVALGHDAVSDEIVLEKVEQLLLGQLRAAGVQLHRHLEQEAVGVVVGELDDRRRALPPPALVLHPGDRPDLPVPPRGGVELHVDGDDPLGAQPGEHGAGVDLAVHDDAPADPPVGGAREGLEHPGEDDGPGIEEHDVGGEVDEGDGVEADEPLLRVGDGPRVGRPHDLADHGEEEVAREDEVHHVHHLSVASFDHGGGDQAVGVDGGLPRHVLQRAAAHRGNHFAQSEMLILGALQ